MGASIEDAVLPCEVACGTIQKLKHQKYSKGDAAIPIIAFFGLFLVAAVLFKPVVDRQNQEDQRRFQREYLTFHGKLDSLTTKMNALEEQGGRMKDLLLAGISDGKPHSELRTLLDDTYAQLATLRTDYLLYETQMHAAMKAMSADTFDKVQELLGQQPSQTPQTQLLQVPLFSSSAPLPGYSSVASKSV
ncbi:hypothetical protein BJ741DRAFT_644369 [Chytriomyces cf. hyalinus JEL632]|nr:hypothetical protein BJ741DRAFT_644369 [Chytriomyces cf. hyalinus JEL632]